MHPPKNIDVPFIDAVGQYPSIESVASKLDTVSKNEIANASWAEFSYKPDCSFAIAHSDDCIFLKFFITEDHILVRFNQPNDLVYLDSCVEFFIAFDEEPAYYNLEFNSIGTCYLGYGTKENREEGPIEIVKKIKCKPLLYNHNGKMKWELTLVIPNEVFYRHNRPTLASRTCRANFYKCGDDTLMPHYLSWSNIESAKPDFHLPEYFGSVTFENQ